MELYQGKLSFYNSSNGSTWNMPDGNGVVGSTVFQNNQWYDIELNYSSTAGYKGFVNGNLEISYAGTAKTYFDPNSPGVLFGVWRDGTSYPLAGAMSDIYVDTSKTAHSSSFTPSTDNSTNLFQNTVDWSQATDGIENVIGTSGNDTIIGTSGNNFLNGSAGNDSLAGNAGNDTLQGGLGNDTIAGGDGDDVFLFRKGDGNDLISDSTGSNTLSFDNSILQSVVAIFKNNNNQLQVGFMNSSGDQVTLSNVNDVEKIQLSTGSYLTSSDVNSVIQAMSSYATNNSISMTSLNDVENNTGLMSIITGAWHS